MMWNYPDPARATALFWIGSVEVEVVFKEIDRRWHVAFAVDGRPNEVAYSALEIFGGVFETILQFLAIREPQTIVLASDRADLAEIYRTYLQKESRRFGELGYHVDGEWRVLRRFKPTRWPAAVQL